MEQFEELCKEKHAGINKELERHSKWLGEHESKIDILEKSDAANTTQIQSLTKAIGNQTTALWALALSIIASLFGFVIWYIQHL